MTTQSCSGPGPPSTWPASSTAYHAARESRQVSACTRREHQATASARVHRGSAPIALGEALPREARKKTLYRGNEIKRNTYKCSAPVSLQKYSTSNRNHARSGDEQAGKWAASEESCNCRRSHCCGHRRPAPTLMSKTRPRTSPSRFLARYSTVHCIAHVVDTDALHDCNALQLFLLAFLAAAERRGMFVGYLH